MSDDDLFDLGPGLDGADDADDESGGSVVNVEPVEDEEPTSYFGSSDEWVRKFLLPSYHRRVTAKGQSGGARWGGGLVGEHRGDAPY